MSDNANTLHTPKILVVDDEAKNRRLMEAQLAPLGYQVVDACDGHDALEKVQAVQPDVILLDVMMPGLNGFEVVRQLKENDATRLIPVVMLTSLTEVTHRVTAMEMGADDFLSKPVEKIELRARIKSLLKVKAYYDHMRNYQQELEAAVEKQTAALQWAYLDTIHRLARAAEYKDTQTGNHILRVSHYAVAVARQLGQGQKQAEALLYAAPMHDIGKIGVPDSILLKPSNLTAAEWELMKAHTTIGAKILERADSPLLRLAEVIALTHHERWDGTGYPSGLKGEDIPIEGRIVAIADVFDALTSQRPYKPAFSLTEAYAIIRAERGRHFDPDVVDAFYAVKPETLATWEQFRDDPIEEGVKCEF